MTPSPLSPLLIVLSAPSGTGKTTLCENLLKARANCSRAITCTTRKPRPGEKDGVDYFFLQSDEFTNRMQSGQFLEHATVYGNYYGTLKSEVLNKLQHGKDVLLNVDVQGAATLRTAVKAEPNLSRSLVTVFLAPSSLAELRRRLEDRNQDSPAIIEGRMNLARQEIEQWNQFDYLITSDTREEDLRRMLAIVEAEKLKQFRSAAPAGIQANH